MSSFIYMNSMIKILGSTCKYTDPTFGGSSSQRPRLEGQPAGCKAVRVGSWCTEVPAGGCCYDRPATGSNPAAEDRGNDPSRAACCTQPDPRGLVWGEKAPADKQEEVCQRRSSATTQAPRTDQIDVEQRQGSHSLWEEDVST